MEDLFYKLLTNEEEVDLDICITDSFEEKLKQLFQNYTFLKYEISDLEAQIKKYETQIETLEILESENEDLEIENEDLKKEIISLNLKLNKLNKTLK